MARYTKKPVDPSNLGTDPNSYTYVDGYGFTPPPPVITERRMLQFYANGLGFAVLFYFLLSGFVPFLLLRLFALAWPVIRVYGNQVIASSSVILMANLLSSVICLTIPFFVFVLLCRVPLRTAFPLRRYAASDGCRFEVYNCLPLAAGVGKPNALADCSLGDLTILRNVREPSAVLQEATRGHASRSLA